MQKRSDTNKVFQAGIHLRSGLIAGYWTCTGVQGTQGAPGYYCQPSMKVCYKPKNAMLYGAPAAPGGSDGP
jgi:hypothetical protein